MNRNRFAKKSKHATTYLSENKLLRLQNSVLAIPNVINQKSFQKRGTGEKCGVLFSLLAGRL